MVDALWPGLFCVFLVSCFVLGWECFCVRLLCAGCVRCKTYFYQTAHLHHRPYYLCAITRAWEFTFFWYLKPSRLHGNFLVLLTYLFRTITEIFVLLPDIRRTPVLCPCSSGTSGTTPSSTPCTTPSRTNRSTNRSTMYLRTTSEVHPKKHLVLFTSLYTQRAWSKYTEARQSPKTRQPPPEHRG